MVCAQAKLGGPLMANTSSSPPLDATTILDTTPSTTSAQTCGRDDNADKPKRTCVVCSESEDSVVLIQCDEGHPICQVCLDKYILTNVKKLRETDYLPAKAETAQISEDGATLAFLRGACSCPLRGHGCGAAPFGDRLIALNVSDLTFAEYSEGKALLPIARKVDQVVQEGSELALLMPNARMCARCHYGPVELAAGSCNDLTMHHGEVRAPGRAPVSNACPNCGWFADTITAWPRWVRQTTVEEATWATVHAAQETPHDDYHDDEEACTHEEDVPTCSHGHRMARQTGAPPLTYGPRTAVRCDGCSRMDLVESCRHFFHCPPCRYDLCPACAEQRMQCRVSGRRRPTLPLRTPWTPVPSRHRASVEPNLAIGTQVSYDRFRGCTVALLHADGSVDINVPGVGIHSRVARSAIQAMPAEEVDEFGLLSARDSLFEMMDGVLDQDIPERLRRRRQMPSAARSPPATPARARLEADLAQAHAERQAFERRVGRMDRGRQGQRIRGREAAGARPFAQVSLAALAQALAQSAAALTRSRLLLRARPVASIPRSSAASSRQLDAAIAAAIAAAPRPEERRPAVTPTQTADRARSLALLARLTGFEVGSQACAFYLDEAGGDVQAAVRAAVQGATLSSPSWSSRDPQLQA